MHKSLSPGSMQIDSLVLHFSSTRFRADLSSEHQPPPRLLCDPLPSFLDRIKRTAKTLAIQLSLRDYWPSSQQWASGIFKSAVWEPAMSVDLLWLWLPKCVPRYVMCVRLREFLYRLKSRRANDCRHNFLSVGWEGIARSAWFQLLGRIQVWPDRPDGPLLLKFPLTSVQVS